MQNPVHDRGVSVVIPSYNHARFIAGAIQSATAQTLKPLEILVVDDGSTDSTAEVVERLRLHATDHVRMCIRPHAGIGATYTFGLGEARGEIVAFLESDDAWAPTYLSKTVGFLYEHPDVDWVSTAREIIDERGRANGDVMIKRSPGAWITTHSLLASDLGYTPTPVVRARALRDVGPFDSTTHAADCDMALRFSLNHRMAYLDWPLYRYRRHNGNASGNSLRDARALVHVLERFDCEYGPAIGPLRAQLKQCLAKYQGRVGVFALDEDPEVGGDEALQRLRAALRIHPTDLKHLRRWLAVEVLGPKYYAKLRRRRT